MTEQDIKLYRETILEDIEKAIDLYKRGFQGVDALDCLIDIDLLLQDAFGADHE